MALGRSDGLQYATGQGYSVLDARSARDRLDGFAVVDGLGVSVSSGLTLSVAAGTATVGTSGGTVDTVSLATSDTVTVDTADASNPRKDTIYIDTNGDLQAETGTAEAADPSGNTRFNTFQPEPPLPGTEGVILAEVWVGAGASSLVSADIRDRRQPAQAVADTLALNGRFVTHAERVNQATTTSGQRRIFADTSVSGFPLTLSDADTVLGNEIDLRVIGSGDLTLETESAQTIDGQTSISITAEDGEVTVSSDGDDWFSDRVGDFTSILAGGVNIGTSISGGFASMGELGAGFGSWGASDEFGLNDDATEDIFEFAGGSVGLVGIRNTSDTEAAVAVWVEDSGVNILESNGAWATADTDANNCLFFSGSTLVLKNRKGAAKNYTGVGIRFA